MSGLDRPYDVVLYGATGFVGTLTAEYLAAHAPKGLRWAIAGRDEVKLRRLRDRLPAGADIGVLRADASRPAELRDLAERAGVVATTVGPYLRHGEELVAACADAGTDYLDLTGEPEFVDLMYVRHDARARETGARLVHACGFDSVPHDLGVYFTLASALDQFARGRTMLAAARDRARHEPRRYGRRVSTPTGAPRFAPEVGAWALPLPTIDPRIVSRSARALDRYGPDFRYRHFAAVRHLPVALGGAAAVGAAVAAAQLPPVRRRLSDRLAPGEGPSAEKRARSWFRVRFVGEGGGRRVYTEVSGGDPGYDETAKMFAEAALCLALDALPTTSGQVTTAQAMGDALTDRLRAAGITFRVAAER
ncbi:saccharopine dehydrogenase family protein [Streptomyces griseofuscus]|uniref:saccharopine dehydrogenase family protein n=1 Tax=Streptomyces griseofuscus TaxID=146922 RepID=UPI0036FA1497